MPIVNGIFALLAFAFTVLVSVPFMPRMPGTGLDSSWAYAMNVAVANHLVFGRDIVFTFGPLASLYTHLYHPAVDALMLTGSSIIALATFLGCVAIAGGKRNAWVLALPILLAQTWPRDTVLFAIPLMLLLVVERDAEKSVWTNAAILALFVATAMLPLIKASTTAEIVFLGLLIFVTVWQRSRLTAFVGLLAFGLTVILAWVAVGQPLSGFAHYLAAQSPIVSGYADAMTSSGNPWEIAIFLAGAVCVMVGLGLSAGKAPWTLVIAYVAVLFIAFKAGFVRHDSHALEAAFALVLLPYLTVLRFPSRAAIVTLLIGIAGWAGIAHSYIDVRPAAIASRFASEVEKSVDGLRDRLSGERAVRNEFASSGAEIRKYLTLPAGQGTADLYPAQLNLMFASGINWNPRPVPQSYSAYTPELAQLNAAHLNQANAPDRVFFSVHPIDGRYPALEDGASWPALLGAYRPAAYVGDYVVLDKRASRTDISPGAEFYGNKVSFGDRVPIADQNDVVWAKIDVTPTLAGKLAAVFFKLPQLAIHVKYSDGTSQTYRFIAGMGKAGFVLAPTIQDDIDFVAIQGRVLNGLVSDRRRPTSFWIDGARGSSVLWNTHYAVSLAPLNMERGKAADISLMTRPINFDNSGDCHIDYVNGIDTRSGPISTSSKILGFRGWAAASMREGVPNDIAYIALMDSTGAVVLQKAAQVENDGVATYFKHASLKRSGFEAQVDAGALKGELTIRVIQRRGDQILICQDSAVHLVKE